MAWNLEAVKQQGVVAHQRQFLEREFDWKWLHNYNLSCRKLIVWLISVNRNLWGILYGRKRS